MDSEFINRFNEKDELAFALLFKATYNMMLSLANKILGDYQESESVVLLSYRKLFQAMVSFETYIGIRAYLSMIVRNECINYNIYRRSKLRQIKELPAYLDIEDIVYDETNDERERKFYLLVNQLPEIYKNVLLLECQGYNGVEIAKIEKTTPSAIYNRRHLAIKKLKSLLNK